MERIKAVRWGAVCGIAGLDFGLLSVPAELYGRKNDAGKTDGAAFL